MKRLYFWLLGVPAHRVGGPWWYRDFTTERERSMFISDIRLFLYAMAETDGREIFPSGTAVFPPADFIHYSFSEPNLFGKLDQAPENKSSCGGKYMHSEDGTYKCTICKLWPEEHL